LFAVGIVPAILLFFVRRYMPESVRFLLSKSRVREAEQTVAHIETEALGRQRTAGELQSMPQVRPELAVKTGITVLELFTEGRALRTVLIWIVSFGFFWSSNGILFMLPTILTQQGIPLTQAIAYQLVQAIGGVLGYTACSFLIDRYGRRPVLFLYYFVGAFFHLWFAMSTGLTTFAAAFFVGWVNPGVYGSTGVYVGELHPTHIRATAVGWFFGIGRIGSFLVPTVVGLMIAYGWGKYTLYMFALSFLIASVALILIGIETKGRVLEEITQAKPAVA
jgi:putative MFS transporter